MKTCLRLLLPALALLLSSCFQHEMVLNLRKDGSGTITEEKLLGAQMLAMMEQMAAGFGGAGAKAPDPLADLASEEKAKKRCSELGEGVRLKGIERVEKNGAKGVRTIYEFDNVNKLVLHTDDGAKPSGGMGGPGAPPQAAAKPKEPIGLNYAGGVLTVRMPKPEPKEEAPAAPDAGLDAGNLDNPQAMEMAKEMFADMRMAIRIRAEGGIASTDATHADGDTVTLMEMDFGKLTKNPEHLKKLAAIDKNNPAAAMEALKGIDGIRFETKPEIKIELK
jgi:hypothetical protein